MSPRCNGLRLGVAFLLLTCCACQQALDRKFEDHQQKVIKRTQQEVLRQTGSQSSPRKRLSWNQALLLMEKQNSSCRQAEIRVIEAQEQKKQLWKNFVPGLSVGASDSFNVSELGDAFASPSLQVNSFLALGNLLSLPRRKYQNEFLLVGAKLGESQNKRQQTIALYRLTRQGELLELERQGLAKEYKFFIAQADETSRAQALALKKGEDQIKQWQLRHETWQNQVADFFNTNPGQVRLVPAGLPRLDYDERSLDFTDSKRWGALQLKILALQELAQEGRIKRAYLRYLPRTFFGVSAPPLYSSGSSRDFDPGDLRLSPGLRWRLDTTDSIGSQIRRLKRDVPLREWSQQRRRRQEVARLLEGKETLKLINEELAKNTRVEEEYRRLVADKLVTSDMLEIARAMKNFRQKEAALRAKKIDIMTSFWLIDEEKWD